MLTDDEARAINIAVEAALGDDLTCFAPDGTPRQHRIDEALKPSGWSTMGMRMFACDIPNYGTLKINRDIACMDGHYIGRLIWLDRGGKQWQADIEAHVAAYRVDPRPYATDDALALTLVDKIRDMGYPVYIRFAPTGTADDGLNDHRWSGFAQSYTRAEIVVEVGYGVKSPHEFFRHGWGETLALAITRAYLATAEAGAKEEKSAND